MTVTDEQPLEMSLTNHAEYLQGGGLLMRHTLIELLSAAATSLTAADVRNLLKRCDACTARQGWQMTVTDEQAEAFGKLFFNDWSRVYVTDEIKQIRIAKIRSALTAALALPASKGGCALIDRLNEQAEICQLAPLKAILTEAAAALHEADLAIDDANKARRIADRERDEAANALAAADARIAELEVERDEWKRTANSPNSLETAIRLKDDAVKRWKTAEQELDEARKALAAVDATAALNRDFNKYMVEPHAIDMVVAALRAGGK